MLLERTTELERVADLVAGVSGGVGRLLLVGGEAGVGKTSLVTEALSPGRMAGSGVRVLRGYADNVTAAAPLGVVVDALPEAAGLVAQATTTTRLDLFTRLRAMAAEVPTVLVLEDVHWADEASLDLLRFLGRRLDAAPLLVVATYRTDDPTGRRPFTVVLGDLATAPLTERLLLAPLSVEAVRSLAVLAGSPVDPVRLAEQTGGVPFYVTEVLAAPTEAIPATVRDAVLARAAALPDDARAVLDAAAVVGRPAPTSRLVRVADRPASAVSEAVTAGLLVGDGTTWSFRHELARRAVADAIAPDDAAVLHERVLRILLQESPTDHRSIAHHAAECEDHDALLTHAVAAAAAAERVGAHREAVAEYRLALRAIRDPLRRAELLNRLSYECYLTDQLLEALGARQQALELHVLAGDVRAVGDDERWTSRINWFLGRHDDSEQFGRRAIATLEPLGDSRELAMAWSNMSQLRMLADDRPEAVRLGRRALPLAYRLGLRDVETHALNNIGTATDGDDPEGEALLKEALRIALEDGADEHAARAWTNLSCRAVDAFRLPAAAATLDDGIAYCADRDLESWVHYMSSWRAVVHLERGELDPAQLVADRLLHHERLSPVVSVQAELVRGLVGRLRGADVESADAHLQRARSLSDETGEMQRIGPVAAAVAEAHWLRGNHEEAARTAGSALADLRRGVRPWLRGRLVWWASLDGGSVAADAVPEPYRLMLTGAWEDAGDLWSRLGCPLWSAYAWGRAPELEPARRALEVVDALGMPPVREALLRDRRERGLAVPRGPRASTRATGDALLTARETEVLALLAEGCSNAAIARDLFLSERTVGHHVSAILRKLGEPSRGRAVVRAAELGILPANMGTSADAQDRAEGV